MLYITMRLVCPLVICESSINAVQGVHMTGMNRASRRWLLAESLHEGRRLGKYVQQGQLAQFVLQPRGEEEEEVEFRPRLLSACPLSLTWRRSALLCLLVSYFPVRSTCVEGALGNDPVPL